MHAPIISSPSRQGAGALQLPSLPSSWPDGQTAAMQLPWWSRISLSPQLADDGGGADAEVTGTGAAEAEGGGSALTGGATGAPAQASRSAGPDRPSASSDAT
jgi:hypothetical protein